MGGGIGSPNRERKAGAKSSRDTTKIVFSFNRWAGSGYESPIRVIAAPVKVGLCLQQLCLWMQDTLHKATSLPVHKRLPDSDL